MKRKILLLALMLSVVTVAYAIKNVMITTRSLPNGQNGVAYSKTLGAKFGTKPYTWTKTGTLPTGLSLNAGTGAITGTPTVNGTYSVLYTVTDSTGSPTVDNKNLSITIAAGAVVTPVKIDTGSVPNGIVSSAYSAVLAATGGSAPYVWTKNSGTLPAGLSLSSSTGAITGTPTAPGNYNFTARVTDAASQVSDRAFANVIANSGSYLFSEDFEVGCAVASCEATTTLLGQTYFSAWSNVVNPSSSTPPTVQNTTKHAGTYAYKQYYSICSDSANSACGAAHQDLNRYLRKTLSTSPTHIFALAWLYLKSPETGGTKGGIQRKLFWIQPSAGEWSAFLTLDSTSSTNGVRFSTNGSTGCSVTASSVTFGNSTLWDGWHAVKMEVQLNTAGVSDGVVKVWIDGVQLGSTTSNRNIRGSCTTGIDHFRLGDQSDRNNYNLISEYRYWDDLVISLTDPE